MLKCSPFLLSLCNLVHYIGQSPFSPVQYRISVEFQVSNECKNGHMQILQHIPAVFGGFLVLVSYKHYSPFHRGHCTVCLERKRGKLPHTAEKIYVHEMKESVEVLNQQFLQLRVFKAVNWTGMQVKHGSMSSFVVSSCLWLMSE